MSKEISKQLVKCPFCGGDNIISTYNNFVPALLCGGCGAMMTIPWSLNGNTEDELRKKWNTRKPMKRIMERLEDTYQDRIDCAYHTSDCFVDGQADGLYKALSIVKEEGGMNEL